MTFDSLETIFPTPSPPGSGVGGNNTFHTVHFFEAGEVLTATLITTPSTDYVQYITGTMYFRFSGTAVGSHATIPSNLTASVTIPATGNYDIIVEHSFYNASGPDIGFKIDFGCSLENAAPFNDGRLPLGLPNAAIYADADGIVVHVLGDVPFDIISLSAEELADYPAQPEENVLLATGSEGLVQIYLLTTGEYQVNIGPTIDGKVVVVIFDGLPPTNFYRRDFNVYDILESG